MINYGTRFRVESNGTLHASNGQFSGSISGSSISGGTVGGATITGGSISIHKGEYYLEMGIETNHPKVSGLNVRGAIQMNGNGLYNIGNLHTSSGETGQATNEIIIRKTDNSVVGLRFTNGILVAVKDY